MANVSLRSNTFMWYTRAAQALVITGLLGITWANAADWHTSSCGIPRQLQLNIACAFITVPVLAYIMTATGPKRLCVLPWHQYAQLVIDALLFCLWMFPSTAAPYTCASVCQSCRNPALDLLTSQTAAPRDFYVWVGQLTCSCFKPIGSENDINAVHRIAVEVLRKAKLRPGKGATTTKIVSTATRLAAKNSLNVIMAFLFFTTLFLTAFSIYHKKRQAKRQAEIAKLEKPGMPMIVEESYMDIEKKALDSAPTSPFFSGLTSPFSASPLMGRTPLPTRPSTPRND